ncbi:MAG: CPBP family intramembrane glutamic endopeptidase [Chloroherpetonaceae bacterium]|nr:CPBP family intramembrane glutamic endopeptidase [Chloroherpetonaceae bacterium]
MSGLSIFTSETAADRRLKYSLELMLTVWVLGFIGHFTPLKEWPALFLYVLGAIGLAFYVARLEGSWKPSFITSENFGEVLKWSLSIGFFLFAMDIVNTFFYLKRGGAPMGQMEEILVGMNFLYLFPILIIGEEFLWRGLMLSSLLERGMNKHWAILLTTLLFVVNHFAVAPVGFKERGMLAMMALPLGIINGYVIAKTKNVWAGVLIHGISMLAMVIDIFVIPRLV